jgi:hypothetical protein
LRPLAGTSGEWVRTDKHQITNPHPPIRQVNLRRQPCHDRGLVMSKKTKATSIRGAFVPHCLDMLVSPAFQALSYSALRALTRLEIEHMQHGGQNNGQLLTTYDQFQELGLHRDSIGPALRELTILGFIEITRRGRPNAGEHKWPNLFRITYLPTKEGIGWKQPSHEWRAIQSAEHALLLADTARNSSARRKLKKPAKMMPVLVAIDGVSV